ncbi:MAG: S1-like domain-containing RNA-binding protein [Geopsychrobacter sp.]|nr:S1-like domain-containing RNA-binding protein [Geopsychrobacter sp.]
MGKESIEVGRVNEVLVAQVDQRGAWLQVAEESILLPAVEIHQPLQAGQSLAVFIYIDEEGERRATLKKPIAEAGQFAALRAKKIVPAGVLFDFGQGFELPVAMDEIPFRPRQNERTLVRIELDEDGMLCGSCRIPDFLEKPLGLKVGQEVDLLVWRSTDLGVKMIIDNRFEGLLYLEKSHKLQPGQFIKGYVARLREDDKVDLSLNPGGRAGTDIGRDKILQALEGSGFMHLNDESAAEDIRRLLGLSKKQFKRALGGLYKSRRSSCYRPASV